jgi:HEAT repeat protein
MDTSFEAKLKSLVNESAPSMQTRVEQDIHALLSAGGDSYQALIYLIEDPNSDENIKAIACWVLGKLKHKSSVAALLKAFDREEPNVTWEAAKALGCIRSKRAIKPLISALLQNKDVEKRAASAYVLGILRDRRATETLLGVLKNKCEQPKVRGHAAEALAWFGDRRKSVIDALMSGLGDTSVEVRFWSVFALGELKIKRAAGELEKLSARDNEVLLGWWSVSEEASNALGRIKSTSNANGRIGKRLT